VRHFKKAQIAQQRVHYEIDNCQRYVKNISTLYTEEKDDKK